MKRILTAVAVAALLLSGCSTIAEPDHMGLYYLEGNSDGYRFDACIEPGQTGDAEWNNSVVYLPTSLRTWTVDDMPDPGRPGQFVIAAGADSADVAIVSTKPQPDQPSGVQVKVSTKTNFNLNTFCDKDGGVAKVFWEKIGRRYKADTEAGWKDMLNAELVPIQKAIIRDVIREYSADPLIANENGIQGEAQKKVSDRLAVEFNRISGGNFFCGPSFNRAKPECPALELLIISAEYADPGIQAARNEKQKQLELAAAKIAAAEGEARALVAKANGERDAAAALAGLYNSPGWVSLQKTISTNQALVEACKAAKECRLIVGADGNLIMA